MSGELVPRIYMRLPQCMHPAGIAMHDGRQWQALLVCETHLLCTSSTCGPMDAMARCPHGVTAAGRVHQLLRVPQVGKGEFGTVHLAKWLGATVAVKVLKGQRRAGPGRLQVSHARPNSGLGCEP